MITHTDARIRKLLSAGVSCEGIARKIGRPGDIERVHQVGCNCEEKKCSESAIVDSNSHSQTD